MPRRILQLYRGTTAQNDAFTGAAGELTMDTDKKEIRLHDGSTQGGKVIGAGYHPDYTAGIDITSQVTGSGYTALKDGIIYYFTMPANLAIDITVNGVYIMRKGATSGVYSIGGSAIIKKGDVFWMGLLSGGSVYFYPFKGV